MAPSWGINIIRKNIKIEGCLSHFLSISPLCIASSVKVSALYSKYIPVWNIMGVPWPLIVYGSMPAGVPQFPPSAWAFLDVFHCCSARFFFLLTVPKDILRDCCLPNCLAFTVVYLHSCIGGPGQVPITVLSPSHKPQPMVYCWPVLSTITAIMREDTLWLPGLLNQVKILPPDPSKYHQTKTFLSHTKFCYSAYEYLRPARSVLVIIFG